MPSRLSIIPADAVADARLTDGDLRVLAAIGTFTDKAKGGICWPSVETIAEVAGCAQRSVQRSLVRLLEAKWVIAKRRPGRSTVYFVPLDPPEFRGVTVESPLTERSPAPDRAVTQNGTSNVPIEEEGEIPRPALPSPQAGEGPRFAAVMEILPEALRRIPPRKAE